MCFVISPFVKFLDVLFVMFSSKDMLMTIIFAFFSVLLITYLSRYFLQIVLSVLTGTTIGFIYILYFPLWFVNSICTIEKMCY
jgi:hypothetical protein